MKHLFLRRFLPALLCLVLALSLTACGGGTEPPETEGGSSMTGTLSGGKGNVSEPKDDPGDPEKAAGLVLLRACMAEDDQLAGAVAYLGQREPNDRSSMTDWLLENSGGLVSELPFLLEIPAERVLGGESGKLYCIVPRDESTSLAVNHVTWESQGNGVWRMEDDCLRLDLSAGVGSSLSGSFPILISPSGEEMHFQRSRSGEGVPFLPDDMDSIDLTRSYG